jgi:vanillate monooxygenase ferredoxin subunit
MTEWIDVAISRVATLADDVAGYELVDPAGALLPPFTAGAHIDVEVADGVIRQYSLCNLPGDRARFVIAVLRETNGRGGSAAAHATFVVGRRLRIGPPRNLFPLREDARRQLLLAGGIGITPLLAMARQLQATGGDYRLHYAARSVGRMAFRAELAAPPFAARVALHVDDGPAAQRLDLGAVLSGRADGDHLYYCGPAGFMAAVRAAALAAGWPLDVLHCEHFAAAPAAAVADGGFEIRLARRGLRLRVPPDRTILQVLTDHGVAVETSCEQGVCGTCLTRVLDGLPDHRDAFQTDAERSSNQWVTVCCSRARSPCLVLDL